MVLKKIDKSISIESIINSSLLKNEDDEFRVNLEQKLDKQLEDLINTNFFNLKNCNRTEIRQICLNHLNQIYEKYSKEGEIICKRISCRYKDPKYISSCILYYVLEIHYEMDRSKISHRKYREIFRDTLHNSAFHTMLKFVRENLVDVEAQVYREKVMEYSKIYVEILKNYYHLETNIEYCLTKINNSFNFLATTKVVCRETSITKESQRKERLKCLLEEFGLDIKVIFKNRFYQYFLPQYLALIITYITLVREIDEKKLKSSSLETICKHLSLSKHKALVLKDYLLETLTKCSENPLPRFGYTNYRFRNKLLSLWNLTNRIEIKMVLELFDTLGVNHKEFIEKVISFNSKRDVGSVISRLRESDFSFLHYKAIESNIKNLWKLKKITNEQYKTSKKLIEEVLNVKLELYNPTERRKIKSKPLKHDSILYRFKFIKGNTYRIKDPILRKKIQKHLKRVMQNKYPLDLFNNKGVRCSDFYIEGTVKERITTNMIKTYLVNPLIKEKKFYNDNTIMGEFHRITEIVIKKYNSTHHEPVLTHLLMEMKHLNILSMETPVWYKKITGHIDLLGELNDRLVIMEYKPKEAELYKGLIQACIYAFIMSKLLKIDMEKIKCLIFTPKMGLSFESTILNDIIEFIQIQNSKRERRLTLKNNKPYDIEIELLKLINN
jgi:hypothetical protein